MKTLPATQEFFVAGGTLWEDDPSYIVRPADEQLYRLSLAGEYCNVLAARQMGKSSLMVRTANRLQEAGVRTAILDISTLGGGISTPEAWFFGFLDELAIQLDLDQDVDAWWEAHASHNALQRFSSFLRDVVLAEIQVPIALFVDEIDAALGMAFTDDFFAAIRAVYNARATQMEFRRLTFILLGVARPADLIRDRRRTPYNIGSHIHLSDFTLPELHLYQAVFDRFYPDQGTDIMQWVLDWTNGQPYLTQRLCAALMNARESPFTPESVSQAVIRLFFTDEARKESNLRTIRDRIESSEYRSKMLQVYSLILRGRLVMDEERSPAKTELKLTGLVQNSTQGTLEVRNRIYRTVFDQRWVNRNLPNDRRRPVVTLTACLVILASIVGGYALYAQWLQPALALPGRSQTSASPGAARTTEILHTIDSGPDDDQPGDVPKAASGQPGLAFRYVATFGQTSVPYSIDLDHLYFPEGVAVDASGHLWVAETLGGRAMKYGRDGAFLLSIGTAGSLLVDKYHFFSPSDIAVDGAGNVWVADRDSARVVKYDPDGTYLMHLGIVGARGMDNDHFAFPVGVALDGNGSIYVSDAFNHRVQVFDSSGVYGTTIGVTGEPGKDNFHFNNPSRLVVDADGRLYVADMSNHRVQIFDADQNHIATLGITGQCGDAQDNERFCEPRGVAVNTGNIFVADTGNSRVQVFYRATLRYQSTLGGFGAGDNQFAWPVDVAVDATGNLYVADARNHRVQQFDSNLEYAGTFGTTAEPYQTDETYFNAPSRIAVDAAGNIAFVESDGQRFIMLGPDGEPQLVIGEAGVPGEDNAHFNTPLGVAFDAEGNIYLSECANRVQIFNRDGVFQAALGSVQGSGDYEFHCPGGLSVDGRGNLYVADDFNQRVQIFDSSLTYVATLGVSGVPGSDNDHFNDVQDVAVDVEGNMYVADTGNHRVQKFDGSYTWQMTLGVTGECGHELDHFCSPTSVAVDTAGNIYVADSGNARVQIFDPTGTYLATIGGVRGSLKGQFWDPFGVAVDGEGNVYVADTGNHSIQKFTPVVQD